MTCVGIYSVNVYRVRTDRIIVVMLCRLVEHICILCIMHNIVQCYVTRIYNIMYQVLTRYTVLVK